MAVNYTIVPRCVPPFDRLDALTRYAFGLIYDRYRLSAREETRAQWTDDFDVYCVYDRADMARELGVTLPTVRRCMDALVAADVLIMRRSGPHAAWRYYPTVKARAAMGTLEALFERLGYDDDASRQEYTDMLSRCQRMRLDRCK